MANYKLVFNLDYEFLCWGIPQSSLSDRFIKEINLDGQGTFKLRYQKETHFEVSEIKEDEEGISVNLHYPDKEQTIRLNSPAEFHFEENFEQGTDCNTNVYNGTVILLKNE